ncbi:MAG: hypothetical protein A2381_00495 [Bdellovibrionales bacterium RIFOXYB1_FULL_37_110]|nr:MAG: hypothetical protein A2417_11550 [Bdellovibrionales bacterium RIFOXYC1_FULL_37_79]OFZ60872.1 MAG: hypothetical protein A2381_00495 [Bdellovibrionales bacterium RIFOXYB1_FULL_37_110]OFZ62402.1 MAG: hypothetical protein A2577_03160 [Bdellovibrionales bacterium RIFOXYD1_FULL_36_51]
MIILSTLISIFCSAYVFATPKDVEVWFLTLETDSKMSMLLKMINPEMISSKKYVLRDCIPMGDGCFHPQDGYIEDESKKKKVVDEVVNDKDLNPKTINSADVDLIKCDKDNYFDIFCGKAQKINTKSGTDLEIWIDISASLKQYDFSKEAGFCKRRMFIEKVINGCPKESVNISVFNTSIKELGSLDTVCDTHGMNDSDRLIGWIENSNSKKLVIITDIDEYNLKFGNYLNSIHAKIKGDKPAGFTGKDLEDGSQEVISYCKK